MGWTYPSDTPTLRDLYTRIFDDLARTPHYEVLDSAKTAAGRRVWVALRDTRTEERFVALFLCDRHYTGATWGFKDLDESLGPACYDCPLRLLDITETTGITRNEFAIAWRQRVRDRAERRRADRERWKALPVGSEVEIPGSTDGPFTYLGYVRRRPVVRGRSGVRYRL